ncbi:MAG: hypothetical protein HQL10_06935 [Nitrospirae bacterium]|nr:hypothetical protein [Nitrospirota bacterium]
MLDEKTAEELQRLASSESMCMDMEKVAIQRHNPFIKDGKVVTDAYIEFVTQFNKFINHQPKPFAPIIEKEMKL